MSQSDSPTPLTSVGRPSVELDLAEVEDRLWSACQRDDRVLEDVATHLLSAGGKRLRPHLTLAVFRDLAVPGAAASAREAALDGAVVVELIHLASLYHDDVMDMSDTRRGVPSANAEWNNTKAVLAGDLLLAEAFQRAADLGQSGMRHVAKAFADLCVGQSLETDSRFCLSRAVDEYLRSIDGKTAALLDLACVLGALAADAPPDDCEAVGRAGRLYGRAFQIVDDVLDLALTTSQLGKPTRADIPAGVYTLPVLLALDGGAADECDVDALSAEGIAALHDLVSSGPALRRAMVLAGEYLASGRAVVDRVRSLSSGDLITTFESLSARILEPIRTHRPELLDGVPDVKSL